MTADLAGRTILQIVPSLDTGGAERTTVDVAAAIVRASGRALVASEGGRLAGEIEAAGGVVLPFPAATKNPARMLANAARLAALIRREGVDLVHARSRAPAWSALLACRACRVPFVTTYHGIYGGRSAPKRLYNSVMARGDVVIANSLTTARHIAAAHGAEPARLVVIHRGTDFARFDPAAVAPERVAALRRAWSVPEGEKILLLPARLTAWKGQSVLLEAAALLRRGRSDVVTVLAGDPQGRSDYVSALAALAAKLGIADAFRLVGHVEDMPAALLAADVVAAPSLQPEAFGRVAVEAQAMGAPTVVADHGAVAETVLAPPEVAEAERTGWRVPPGEAAPLAAAIAAALALPEAERRALAERAGAHVRARFSLEAMTGATLAIYRRLLPPR